jgi:preprotein translocase subunit SecA
MNTLKEIKAAEDTAKASVRALSDAELQALSNTIHKQYASGEISSEQYDFVIAFVAEEACARVLRVLDAQNEACDPMPEHSTTIH